MKKKKSEKLKFGVGDAVLICARRDGHGFDIGEMVVLGELIDDDPKCPYYGAINARGHCWYVNDQEVTSVPEYRP